MKHALMVNMIERASSSASLHFHPSYLSRSPELHLGVANKPLNASPMLRTPKFEPQLARASLLSSASYLPAFSGHLDPYLPPLIWTDQWKASHLLHLLHPNASNVRNPST
jgi:hypothetical protein